jgi:hypothetical protein
MAGNDHSRSGRTNRRHVLGLAAGGGVAATVLGLGRLLSDGTSSRRASAQDTPAVIRAQRFELVDASGAPRAILAMGDSGAMIEVLDEAGQARAQIVQTPEGEYAFAILDAHGTQRWGVGTTKRGFVGMGMRDGSGTFRANMQVADDGSYAGFRAADEHDAQRLFLGLRNDGSGYGLELQDGTGKVVWTAP